MNICISFHCVCLAFIMSVPEKTIFFLFQGNEAPGLLIFAKRKFYKNKSGDDMFICVKNSKMLNNGWIEWIEEKNCSMSLRGQNEYNCANVAKLSYVHLTKFPFCFQHTKNHWLNEIITGRRTYGQRIRCWRLWSVWQCWKITIQQKEKNNNEGFDFFFSYSCVIKSLNVACVYVLLK